MAGISVAALIGVIVGIKNKDFIKALWESLQKNVAQSSAKATTRAYERIEIILQESLTTVESILTTEIIQFPAHRDYQKSFDVRDHLRNLQNSYRASVEKIEFVAEHGYKLQLGQPWFEAYTKGCNVA